MLTNHISELQLYQQWLSNNKENLKTATVSDLESLIETSRETVREVDTRLAEYVSSLVARDRDQIRSSANLLDQVREVKRESIVNIVKMMKGSWQKEARDTDFVSFTL